MEQGILDWEDRDIFFDEFAVDATLEIVSTGRALALKGIFDTPYAKRDFGVFFVDADDPSFTCVWTPELAKARAGDKLTIKSEEFFLESSPKSDGTGLVSLILTRESTQDDIGDAEPEQTEAPPGGGLFSPNPGRS